MIDKNKYVSKTNLPKICATFVASCFELLCVCVFLNFFNAQNTYLLQGGASDQQNQLRRDNALLAARRVRQQPELPLLLPPVHNRAHLCHTTDCALGHELPAGDGSVQGARPQASAGFARAQRAEEHDHSDHAGDLVFLLPAAELFSAHSAGHGQTARQQ